MEVQNVLNVVDKKVWDWSELKADGKDDKTEGGDDQSETSDGDDGDVED